MNDLVRFATSVELATGKKRGRHPVFSSSQFYPYAAERRLQNALRNELEDYIGAAYGAAVSNNEYFKTDSMEELALLPEELSDDFKAEISYAAEQIARKVSSSIAEMTEMTVGKPYYPQAAKESLLKDWEANFQMLCVSAESDAKKDIARLVTQAKNEGWNGKQLEKAVMKELPDKYANRASVIARTESAKLNTSVALETYKEIGCKYYMWMATLDERVRLDHAMMNGLICSATDPTVYFDENPDDPMHPIEHKRDGTMVHLHPGEDFQCRCTMVMWDPVIDGKYEVKEATEDEETEEPEKKPESDPASRELEKANEALAEKENELETTKAELRYAEERLSGYNESYPLLNESFQNSEREIFELKSTEALKSVDEKKFIEKAKKENEFGLPVMDKPETALSSLEMANSNAKKDARGFLELEWSSNCQRSVIAYEARRRGYKVRATKSFDGDILAMANNPDLWTLVFSGATPVVVEYYHPKTIEREISNALKKYGNGSRVIIRYEGKFGFEGHVFIGENINGRIFFVDPQTNEFYGTEIFSGQKKKSFAYTRVDNLKFTDKIVFAVD